MDELDGPLTPRHPAQERERRDVVVAARFHALCGVGLDEACVAVRAVKDELVDGLLHFSDHRFRLTEVALGVTGGVTAEHTPPSSGDAARARSP